MLSFIALNLVHSETSQVSKGGNLRGRKFHACHRHQQNVKIKSNKGNSNVLHLQCENRERNPVKNTDRHNEM